MNLYAFPGLGRSRALRVNVFFFGGRGWTSGWQIDGHVTPAGRLGVHKNGRTQTEKVTMAKKKRTEDARRGRKKQTREERCKWAEERRASTHRQKQSN